MMDIGAFQITAAVIAAWLVVAAGEVTWRIVNGASALSFFENAFDEVVCVQWYLYAFVWILFATVVGCLLLSARGIWALFQCHDLAGTVDWSLAIWVAYPLLIG